MGRIILLSLMTGIVPLMLGCGNDGGIRPRDEKPPRGFTCTYRDNDSLGLNGCRMPDVVYEYDVWLDWWTDSTAKVDSVLFVIPVRLSTWYEHDSICLKDSTFDYGAYGPADEVGPLIGQQVDNHWEAGTGVHWYHHHIVDEPWFSAYSLVTDGSRAAKAFVVCKDGRDSVYTAYPIEK